MWDRTEPASPPLLIAVSTPFRLVVLLSERWLWYYRYLSNTCNLEDHKLIMVILINFRIELPCVVA